MKYTGRILLIGTVLFVNCGNNGGADDPLEIRDDGAYRLDIRLAGSLQNSAWSPDGEAIVFTRFRNGYNKGPADLIVFDLASATHRVLVSDGSENVNLPGSTWNQATGQIVFSSSRGAHDEIYSISEDTETEDATPITGRADRVSYEPSFAPDGRRVVFESHELDVEENGVITTYNLDGPGVYQELTGLAEDCRQPNWSPAGTLIVYQKLAAGSWDIWTTGTDGTHQQQVTQGIGDKTDASFAPDGQWIVYSGDGEDIAVANLFTISVSGGVPTKVTNYDGYDGAPSWGPDMRRVVFESSPSDPEQSGGTELWIIELPAY